VSVNKERDRNKTCASGGLNDGKNLGMFGEFEDAEDAENADEREAAAAFGAFTVAFRLLNDKDDEVWEDGEHVDDVHHVPAEMTLRWTRHKAHHELAGEPSNACLLTHVTTSTHFMSYMIYHTSLHSFISRQQTSHDVT